MDEQSEWTEVKSVSALKNEKRLTRILGDREEESTIMSKHTIFLHDQNSNKIVFNTNIFTDVELTNYVEQKFKLNKTFINKRMVKINQFSIKYLTNYFLDKEINTKEYKLICYCPELEIIQKIEGKLTYNLAFYKLTLKDENIFKIVGIFKTSTHNLPYSIVTYIENKMRKTNEKIYFFQNYLQVLLFLSYIELSISINTPNMVDFYPVNFKSINKDELHKYFITYNKIW